jgi:uncharacterized FAD-dependent dehydrogenase
MFYNSKTEETGKMGYKQISLRLPAGYDEAFLKKLIRRKTGLTDFSYTIENKSLDARDKRDIRWQIRVLVFSKKISGDEKPAKELLNIPFKKRDEKVVVAGSGPAGFFAAFVLQQAGFNVTIIERGSEVNKRARGIARFESTGIFDPVSNYAFGEGGAGTFSDGKLTSRSKRISAEKQFILSSYIAAGAPAEIEYMTHPHLGSDNLKRIVVNLRKRFVELGGTFLFETVMTDISVKSGKVTAVDTNKGLMDTDHLLVAPGHSAYDTYRMLIKRGVGFHPKNFAIGSRMEHRQEIINIAQWGVPALPGVKAAEYRLTSKGDGHQHVYSFCMCPGGVIVPATPVKEANIVNGMSRYQRDEQYANAALAASFNPEKMIRPGVDALEILDWMEKLENSFYRFSQGYKAPYCSIQDFIRGKLTRSYETSSYPMGIGQAPLWEMLPAGTATAMRAGLKDFIRKMKGFATGNIIGLESKTSAPIQVDRDKSGKCAGFDNLYVIGEGSGYAGGIVSSAADGIKVALGLCR